MPGGWRAPLELPLGHILDRLNTVEGIHAEFLIHQSLTLINIIVALEGSCSASCSEVIAIIVDL